MSWATTMVTLPAPSTALPAHPTPAIALHSPKPGEPAVIRVSSLPKDKGKNFAESKPSNEAWQALLHVSVAGQSDDAIAVLGAYRVDGDAVLFEPRFPFAPGTSYRVRFDPSKLP